MASKLFSTLWEVWGEPFLTCLSIFPDRKDHDYTYGRHKIPFSSMEKRMHQNQDVEVWFGKCEDQDGMVIWYQVWQDKKFKGTKEGSKDLLFCHGTGVHSGTFASHARRYLDAGFRLIVPDLPGHGYSSHLHVYVPEMRMYTQGLHAVLHDVNSRDDCLLGRRVPKKKRSQTYILGLSFGGLVAIYYGHMYPNSVRESEMDQDEIPIDGIIGVGPMIGYSRDSIKLHPMVQNAIRMGVSILQAGRLELIVPHKKSVDRDPKVYAKLVSEDPRSHQGAFRAAHLVCIDDAMKYLETNVKDFRHPLLIQQGGQDRVADTGIAYHYLARTSTEKKDKSFWIYPICQHVIYRKAKTEEEDKAGRIVVIGDNVEWMKNRSLSIDLQRSKSQAEMEAEPDSDSGIGFDSDSETQVSESEAGSFFGSEVESESENEEEFTFASFRNRSQGSSRLSHQPLQFAKDNTEFNYHQYESETPKLSRFIRKPSSSNLSRKHSIPSLSISASSNHHQVKALDIFSPLILSPIPSPTPRHDNFSALKEKSERKVRDISIPIILRAKEAPTSLRLDTRDHQTLKVERMSVVKSPSPNSRYHFDLEEIKKVSYLDHPLTAKAHPSTLPRINQEFGDKKSFRQKWSLHDALRPFELAIED